MFDHIKHDKSIVAKFNPNNIVLDMLYPNQDFRAKTKPKTKPVTCMLRGNLYEYSPISNIIDKAAKICITSAMSMLIMVFSKFLNQIAKPFFKILAHLWKLHSYLGNLLHSIFLTQVYRRMKMINQKHAMGEYRWKSGSQSWY